MISEYKEQKKTESINSRQAEEVTNMHTARKKGSPEYQVKSKQWQEKHHTLTQNGKLWLELMTIFKLSSYYLSDWLILDPESPATPQ